MQGGIFETICNVPTNLRKLGKDNITKNQILSRLACLEKIWDKYSSNNDQLMVVRKQNKELPYFLEDHYTSCEEKYLSAKSYLMDFLDKFEALVTKKELVIAPTVTQKQKAFPRLELPKFSGIYTEWPTFRDLFDSMVRKDTDLPMVQKLHYLKVSVTGEPAQLIASIPTTENNFERAWQTLVKRYDNARLLVNSYLAKLFSLKPMSRESSTELRSLLNDTCEIVGALTSLNRPTDEWDDLLVYMTAQRLDTSTRKAWEDQLGSSSTHPKFDSLNQFLTGKISTLEAVENIDSSSTSSSSTKNSTPRQKGKRGGQTTHAHSATLKEMSCSLCSGKHSIIFCPQFRSKDDKQRKELVRKHLLCFNCLGKHMLRNCVSTKRCQTCSGMHHTMLHPPSQDKQTSSSSTETATYPTNPSSSSKLNPLSLPFSNSLINSTGTTNAHHPQPSM